MWAEERSNKINETILPVTGCRTELVRYFKENDTCIVMGETGSGKTTQIPQFLLQCGMTSNKIIAVTQPRRVAAVSLATYVAQSMNTDLGGKVGYHVRFDQRRTHLSKIMYMTDGILLREAMFDPLLSIYSVIILDEAHERTVRTDVLFGVVKQAQRQRKLSKASIPLRIIIMSATMDVDQFSAYFNQCPVLYVEGRQYPVKLSYALTDVSDYLYSTLVLIFQLHRELPLDHDFLVFLTGSDEIESAIRQCRELARATELVDFPIKFLPLYAALPQQQQLNVFTPAKKGIRKVVIATNIAETSLTIPGIHCVIDSCKVKMRIYDAISGIDMLRVQNVSSEQANQRAGRAGRQGAGQCIRLISEQSFSNLSRSTEPEILRSNLASVALELLTMGLTDLASFDFMDKPNQKTLADALRQLFLLRAITIPQNSPDSNMTSIVNRTGSLKGNNVSLTTLGKRMAKFPLDPKLSRTICASEEYGCTEEILVIVSIIECEQSILVSSAIDKDKCQAAHAKFTCAEGDHIMLLKIFRAYKQQIDKNQFCHQNFLHARALEQVTSIRKQLHELCVGEGMKIKSCGSNLDVVRKCLCAGFFMQAAEIEPDLRSYQVLDTSTKAIIHPSSCLQKTSPRHVIYTELLLTSSLYMKIVSVVDGEWLNSMEPEFFRIKRLRL